MKSFKTFITENAQHVDHLKLHADAKDIGSSIPDVEYHHRDGDYVGHLPNGSRVRLSYQGSDLKSIEHFDGTGLSHNHSGPARTRVMGSRVVRAWTDKNTGRTVAFSDESLQPDSHDNDYAAGNHADIDIKHFNTLLASYGFPAHGNN